MNWNELQRPDRLSATPLYDQVEEILRRAIRTGDLAPGQVFPSEPELAALFGVSRLTVRRSLGNLQRTGLIVRRHGVGTFVARVGAAQIIPSSLSFTKNMQMVGLQSTSRAKIATQSPCRSSAAPSPVISEEEDLVPKFFKVSRFRAGCVEKAWQNGFAVPELDTHAVEGGSLYDDLSRRAWHRGRGDRSEMEPCSSPRPRRISSLESGCAGDPPRRARRL